MKPTVSTPFGLVKRLILSLVLALGLATSANAEKIYSKEDASYICAVSLDNMLVAMDDMLKEGRTVEEIKAAVSTKDPEMKALILRFITEGSEGKDKAAQATLLLIHSTCTKKLQEVEA